MYRMDQKEVDRIAGIIKKGRLFRYGTGGECERFERRYAEKLGVKYCTMTASGTYSLTAALIALNIGPGDEVLVPACTYMATAMAVFETSSVTSRIISRLTTHGLLMPSTGWVCSGVQLGSWVNWNGKSSAVLPPESSFHEER